MDISSGYQYRTGTKSGACGRRTRKLLAVGGEGGHPLLYIKRTKGRSGIPGNPYINWLFNRMRNLSNPVT